MTILNKDANASINPFKGYIEDDAIRIIYHEDDGAVNEIKFKDFEVLEIKRFTKGFKSNIYLSKDECYAKIHTDEGDLEIPIVLKEMNFSKNEIRASYYTGENFEILIEFFKE